MPHHSHHHHGFGGPFGPFPNPFDTLSQDWQEALAADAADNGSKAPPHCIRGGGRHPHGARGQRGHCDRKGPESCGPEGCGPEDCGSGDEEAGSRCHRGPHGPHGGPRGGPYPYPGSFFGFGGPWGGRGGRGGRGGFRGCGGRGDRGFKGGKNPAEFVSDIFNSLFDNVSDNLAPAIDVYNLPEAYLIVASVAGARPADVKVDYDPSENTLHIRGKFSKHTRDANEQYLVVNERATGDFERYVKFDEGQQVDEEDISAKFINGVLKIQVPKVQPEPVENKQVPISVYDSDDEIYDDAKEQSAPSTVAEDSLIHQTHVECIREIDEKVPRKDQ